MKTPQQIEEMAEKLTKEYHPCLEGIDKDKYYLIKEVATEAYAQAQKDLLESASERFDYWWNDGKDIPEILGRASQVVLAITNMSERCSRLSEFWAKESWQACAISYEKKIQKLKEENESLKVNLNTCKNDYWFMTNLLEKYSTDKEQAIKDCIERMKFRKLLFKQEIMEGK